MPVTLASIEAELLVQVGPYLRKVGLDGTTADGTNPALRGAIRRAVGRLGIATADPIAVADADLADLTRDTYETLLDLAELRALETCWGNWPEYDEQAGSESQKLSQLADRLERRIKALTDKLGPLAAPPGSALLPGPSAHGLIRAGRPCPPGRYPVRYASTSTGGTMGVQGPPGPQGPPGEPGIVAASAPLVYDAATGTLGLDAADTFAALGLGTAATQDAGIFDPAGSSAAVAGTLAAHAADVANPHGVTKAQVGLGDVDNTPDAAKPISTATAAALALKAPLASPAFTGTMTGDGSGLTKLRAGQVGYFKPPAFDSWFPYRIAPNPTTGLPTVYNADGTAFDAASLKPANAGVTYYVGYTGASDGNDGLTTGTSLGSIWKALQKADVGEVVVKAGYTTNRNQVSASVVTVQPRNLIIRGDTDGSPALFSNHETTLSTSSSWTATAGRTNVWQATPSSGVRTLIAAVWDANNLDADGDYGRLTLKATIAEVEATAASYFVDGTNIYVRTADNRQPDSNIRVMLGQLNLFLTSNGFTLYLENIRFEGGTNAFQYQQAGARPRVVARACAFKYGSSNTQGNGTQIQGADAVFQDCIAAKNALDGFNYHISGAITCRSIEVNCVGRNNGWNAATDSNNGSTTHDGNSAVRVGGKYYGNYGPNVADVDAGTTTWSVGCGAWGSTATTAAQQNSNYQSQCGGSGGMWLDACWGRTDPTVAAQYQFAASTSGANLSFRSFSGAIPFYAASAATLRSY